MDEELIEWYEGCDYEFNRVDNSDDTSEVLQAADEYFSIQLEE